MIFIEGRYAMMAGAVRVWCARIDDVGVEGGFESAVRLLTEAEQKDVRNYVFAADQRRSLLGKLLQRHLVVTTTGLRSGDYEIKRTPEGKPYLFSSSGNANPFWNFNLSHHGSFVGIAASSSSLIGLDIVDIATRSNGVASCAEYVSMFTEQLTPFEMQAILSEPSEDLRYRMFFIYWSLKEAYIKAVGLGLGLDLQQVEFRVSVQGSSDELTGTAAARIGNADRSDWRFALRALDEHHIIAVGLGPLHDALPSHQATWGWRVDCLSSLPPSQRSSPLTIVTETIPFRDLAISQPHAPPPCSIA